MKKMVNEISAHGVMEIVCTGVIENCIDSKAQKTEENVKKNGAVNADQMLELPELNGKETIQGVKIYPHLSETQTKEVREILNEFKDVLTDVPGETNLVMHEINLTSDHPVRTKQYPLPFSMTETIRDETEKMLKLGIIEPSQSPYSSPVVLVKKPDQTIWFCIDFRNLNKLTVFDAEPIPNPEKIFAKLSNCKYFTKIDLSKGYWQIKMTHNSKEKTAFCTPDGLF